MARNDRPVGRGPLGTGRWESPRQTGDEIRPAPPKVGIIADGEDLYVDRVAPLTPVISDKACPFVLAAFCHAARPTITGRRN